MIYADGVHTPRLRPHNSSTVNCQLSHYVHALQIAIGFNCQAQEQAAPCLLSSCCLLFLIAIDNSVISACLSCLSSAPPAAEVAFPPHAFPNRHQCDLYMPQLLRRYSGSATDCRIYIYNISFVYIIYSICMSAIPLALRATQIIRAMRCK